MVAFRRQIIVSKNGYFGLVSQEVEAGDLVCLSLGGVISVILRQESDHFLFVGESYIHGVMLGEMEDLHAGKFRVRDFKLH